MKKYTTIITTEKGEQKEISVWLDDETAKALDEANDPEITQFYILDKHQEDLIDLKETRRHISLDGLIEQGHLIADENGNPAEYVERMERILKMRDKLNNLLAKNTNQDIKQIELDTERDNFMTADEAMAYGLIDKVITKKEL